MKYLVKQSLVAAAGLLSASCGSPRFTDSEPIDTPEITLHLENRNFSDATLYAVENDLRMRVGRVTGKTDRTLRFRWAREELRMEVRFTAGPRLISGRHSIVPGANDELLLIISLNPTIAPLLTARR